MVQLFHLAQGDSLQAGSMAAHVRSCARCRAFVEHVRATFGGAGAEEADDSSLFNPIAQRTRPQPVSPLFSRLEPQSPRARAKQMIAEAEQLLVEATQLDPSNAQIREHLQQVRALQAQVRHLPDW